MSLIIDKIYFATDCIGSEPNPCHIALATRQHTTPCFFYTIQPRFQQILNPIGPHISSDKLYQVGHFKKIEFCLQRDIFEIYEEEKSKMS